MRFIVPRLKIFHQLFDYKNYRLDNQENAIPGKQSDRIRNHIICFA